MKKLLLLLMMIGVSSVALAQRKTITKEYYKDSPLGIAGNMSGKITYGYIIDSEGNELKDGPLSIRASTVNEKVYVYPYSAVLNGSFTVTATCVKGDLNGPFSSSYKLTATGASIFGDKDKGSITATITGSFSNAIPNGTFNVKSNVDFPASLTATYKNGKLVGPFNCSYRNGNGLVASHKGTLTQNSQLTGTWTFSEAVTIVANFINGVLISESKDGKSTKPAISELAKQYANRTITEQQLYQRGCIIKEDSVALGDCASDIILGQSYVNFEKLGGYDFTEPNVIKYKYLKEIAVMTDAGINALIEGISEYVRSESTNKLSYICADYYSNGLKYSCIKTDANGNNYVYMHRNQNKGYAKGGFEDWYDNIYISDAQMKQIESSIEEYLVKNPHTLKNCIVEIPQYPESLNAYMNGDGGNMGLKSLQRIESELNKIYNDFCNQKKPHPTNENIVIWEYKNKQGTNVCRYIDKTSIESVASILTKLQNEIAQKKAAIENAERERARIAAEAKKRKLMALVQPAVNFMKQEQKPLHICYGYNEKFFYTSTRNELWKSDLEKRLKPLCPINDIEIVDVDETTVVLKIKKVGKKKDIMTYQIAVRHRNGRLCVESFDIANAKLL